MPLTLIGGKKDREEKIHITKQPSPGLSPEIPCCLGRGERCKSGDQDADREREARGGGAAGQDGVERSRLPRPDRHQQTHSSGINLRRHPGKYS